MLSKNKFINNERSTCSSQCFVYESNRVCEQNQSFPELKPRCSSLGSILFHPETQLGKFSLRTRSSRIHYAAAQNGKRNEHENVTTMKGSNDMRKE